MSTRFNQHGQIPGLSAAYLSVPFSTLCAQALLAVIFLGMSANAIAQDIERVSVNALGLEANFDSQSPSISADGRLVAFMSSSSNLVVDTNNASDVFVYIESGRIFGSSFEGPD